jgi:hypothetical protein
MAAKIRAKGSDVVHCARGLPAEMLAAFAELLRDYELRHTTPNPTIDEMLAMGEAMRRRVNRHEQGASQFAAFGKTAKAFVLHVRAYQDSIVCVIGFAEKLAKRPDPGRSMNQALKKNATV